MGWACIINKSTIQKTSLILGQPAKFNAHFPDMDSNNNDRVTFEEFKAKFPDASGNEDVFKAIDLDGNGELTHEEWHEFKSAHDLKHTD